MKNVSPVIYVGTPFLVLILSCCSHRYEGHRGHVRTVVIYSAKDVYTKDQIGVLLAAN